MIIYDTVPPGPLLPSRTPYLPSVPSRTRLAAYAEKKGGGKRFLIGRRTWKTRWFVIGFADGSLGYWGSAEQLAAHVPPLKPMLSLAGAAVETAACVAVGACEAWPFTLRWPRAARRGESSSSSLSSKTQLALRTGEAH